MSLFEAEMGEEAVKAFEKEQETVAIGVAMEHSQGNKTKEEMLCYVLFTDFQVVALLPDASGTNYVSNTITDQKTLDKVYASNVKNMTKTPITATQQISTSYQRFTEKNFGSNPKNDSQSFPCIQRKRAGIPR